MATLLLSLGLVFSAAPSFGQTKPVTIVIVRHAETDSSQPNLPLSAVGRQRAELLAPTVRGMKFTHLFATHTIRTRQMLEAIASAHSLPIVQLPVPGTILDGQTVTDLTTRRAPIEPISEALLKLPPGSVALAALNSENIFAILNKLGVPLAEDGKQCAQGSVCVPCLDNKCFPPEFDRLWFVVLEPGRTAPIVFSELRYGIGWRSASQ